MLVGSWGLCIFELRSRLIVVVKFVSFVVYHKSMEGMGLRRAWWDGQVKFSPFLENRIAVATSQNFGIIGTGRQHILDVSFAIHSLL